MILTIFFKEMKSFFRSPIAYIISGLFTLIVGWLFFSHLTFFVENIQKVPISMRHTYDFANEVIIKLFGNLNFLFLFMTPILSMKSFADEYANHTIELYYSSPISKIELVIAKVLTLFAQGAFLILLTLIYPCLLGNIDLGDTSFVFTGYVGLFLNYCCFATIGVLASCLSASPIVAALVGFVLNLFLWMMGWFGTLSSNFLVAEILKFLSINYHYQNFVNGLVSLSDISYYISFIILMILLINKKLEMREWS
jgi:ABC-2 type transport system permease protein